MSLNPTPTFEIVDLQAPDTTTFSLLIVSPIPEAFIIGLREELDLQISASLGTIDAKGMAPSDLLDELRLRKHKVFLIYGLDEWPNKQFASLDVNRSRMEVGSFLLFGTDFKTAGRFLDNAPNIRSYFGANIFRLRPDGSWMTPQQIAERLNELRVQYALSDSDVVSQAIDGSLPPEPELLEWLVLLGKGNLVR